MIKSFQCTKIFWIAAFAFTAALHLAGIFQPFLGNFAQHQTDYATVVQRWLAEGIHPLDPVMRFIAEGKNRLFMGDIPLNITITAFTCKLTGLSIEMVGRGLSAMFFFLSIYPLYRLLQLVFKDQTLTLLTVLFYSFSPLTMIYGQAFLLEMTALSFGIFAYYFYFRWWYQNSTVLLLVSAFFFSLMLGTRIYYAPLILPLALLFLKRFGWKSFIQWRIYLFLLIVLFAPVSWQAYAKHFANLHGDQSSLEDNLRVFVSLASVLNLKFLAAFTHISFTKIVTPAGFILALPALFIAPKYFRKSIQFVFLIFLSFLPLVLMAPRKFIEFEYYYLPFVPVFSLLAAIGIKSLEKFFQISLIKISLLVIATVLLSLRYSVAPVLIVPDEDRFVLEAAKKVREIAPRDSRVIASHGSGTSFLFYTDRDGWAFELPENIRGVRNLGDIQGSAIERLERFRSQGAVYFALADKRQMSQNPAFFDYLKSRYKLAAESPHYLIYSLEK